MDWINAVSSLDGFSLTQLLRISVRQAFQLASSFNQPIGNWSVSKVTTMRSMFSDAVSFNHSLDEWDVSGVTSMAKMFLRASSFNQPLQSWNTHSVIDMLAMFESSSFNQNIAEWNVSQVEIFEDMFQLSGFNQDLSCTFPVQSRGRSLRILLTLFQSLICITSMGCVWSFVHPGHVRKVG